MPSVFGRFFDTNYYDKGARKFEGEIEGFELYLKKGQLVEVMARLRPDVEKDLKGAVISTLAALKGEYDEYKKLRTSFNTMSPEDRKAKLKEVKTSINGHRDKFKAYMDKLLASNMLATGNKPTTTRRRG